MFYEFAPNVGQGFYSQKKNIFSGKNPFLNKKRCQILQTCVIFGLMGVKRELYKDHASKLMLPKQFKIIWKCLTI